ncbi:MAG: winged helix-turn-helix transcriptional regulator [Gemmatimonadales bacterium]|nr:winged helix-turn-helix transcriptional regulator [Gemmatimonadales bacterium]
MSSTRSIRRFGSERRLDLVFRALAGRPRRQILARLAQGPATISELARPLRMSLPAVSRHVLVLERAGLLIRAIDGRVHHCTLGHTPFQEMNAWLAFYRPYWEGTLDALARYAESETHGEPR